jgi:hypothetical protein
VQDLSDAVEQLDEPFTSSSRDSAASVIDWMDRSLASIERGATCAVILNASRTEDLCSKDAYNGTQGRQSP